MMHNPNPFTFVESDPSRIRFRGRSGEMLRISVLDDSVIHVQHCPDGSPRMKRTWSVCGPDGLMPHEGRLRDDLQAFPCPAYQLETGFDAQTQAPYWAVDTATVKLRINAGPALHLQWSDASGRLFASDLPSRAYYYSDTSVFHYMRHRPGDVYLGFGEKTGRLNKAGQRLRMHNMDALGYDAEHSDPLYKHWSFYITWLPDEEIAYGILYDNLATSHFDMGREVNALRGDRYRYYCAEGGDLDYYMLCGPDIPAVLQQLHSLIGAPVLPPRWSLGYLGSTMHYTEMPDAQQQLLQFIALCQQHEIPCDLFHLSSGYTTGTDGARYVFTWNRGRVPDPQKMIADFHDAGMHLAANIKPYLLVTHPAYQDLAAARAFIQAADGDGPELNEFWAGGIYTNAPGSYIDFSSEAGYRWWQAQAREQLLDYGIDVLWNDNNEFEVDDPMARSAGYGDPLPAGWSRPLQTLLMARASFEATQAAYPDRRAFILTRAAAPGIQRYAQSWSGDNFSSWHTLRWNIPMGLGLSLSGLANTGHDVGGFFGPAPEPELWLRWVQCGIFMPRFTIHSASVDGSVNAPWMYPEMLPLVREAIQLRYRLIPYLYSLFVRAQSSVPIMAPTLYYFPSDPRCFEQDFEWMLGPNLLVAPVLEPGARERSLYLPAGSDWVDFWRGDRYAGGQTVTVPAPLDQIPLFVPAGAMLPMGKVMPYIGAEPDDLRVIYAFPAVGGTTESELVEDDGRSLAYQRGGQTVLALRMDCQPDEVSLTVVRLQSGWVLPYDEMTFILPAYETRTIRVAGELHRKTDEQGRLHIQIRLMEE